MGFEPWVPQQDTNTEIRVAMLLSLSLQIALIFLGPMRKRSSFPRVIVWSCYLLADWVADLALGLLLNNMGNIGSGGNSTATFGMNLQGGGSSSGKKSSSDSDSPNIFAFWTPFLLLHLGGPDTITAYSVEDNELWIRHLIGLLFELFSAAVIFFCSLRNNPMLPATVLMFIAGIIKYGERTYSLYSGSIQSFRANILGTRNPGRKFASKKKEGLAVEIYIPNGEAPGAAEKTEIKTVEAQAYDFFLIFRRLFVDLVLNSKQRMMSRGFFLEHSDMDSSKAFEIIDLELNFIYDMVYTKAPVAYTRAGWFLRFICFGCIASSLVIFYLHDKRGIKRVDVGVTYVLLLGGLALDMAALAMLLLSDRARVFLQRSRRFRWLEGLLRVAAKLLRGKRGWSQSVAQFSLITYASDRPFHYKGLFYLTVARILHVKEALDDLIFIRHVPLPHSTLTQVFFIVRNAALHFCGGPDKDGDIEKVFNFRGDLALKRFEDEIKNPEYWVERDESSGNKRFKLIMDIVVKIKDFDESLILWHIATDLCREFNGPLGGVDAQLSKDICLPLPDYMMYLLIKQPEMLSARTGIWLMRYQDTCAEARRFFGSKDSWISSVDDAREMLLDVNTSEVLPVEVNGDVDKSVLFDACALAQAVQDLGEDLKWKVMSEVWVGMLMYAAHKCPGSTHVRQLNRGGELITLVWFLMEHMGLGDVYDTTKGGSSSTTSSKPPSQQVS